MADERDVERIVDKETFVKTLRRAADAILAIEHEREEDDGKITEEVELQLRWSYSV